MDKEFNRQSVYTKCYKRFRKISNPIYGECELLKLDNPSLSKLNISKEKKYALSKTKLILSKKKMVNDIEEFGNDLEVLKKRKMIHHENLIELLDYEATRKSDFCSTFFVMKSYYKFYMTNLREQVTLRSEDNHHFTEKELVGFLYDTLDVLSYLQKHGVPHGDIRPELLFFEEIDGKTVTKLGERMSEHDSVTESQLNHLMNGSKIYMSPKLFFELSKGNLTCEHNVFKSDLFSLGLVFLEMGNLLGIQDVYNRKIGEISKEKLDVHYERFYTRYENSPLLCSAVKTMIELGEKKRSNAKRLYKRLPDMEEIKQYYDEVEKINQEVPSRDEDLRQGNELPVEEIASEVNTIPKGQAPFENRQTFEPNPELQKIYHQNQVEIQKYHQPRVESKLDQYYFDEEEYKKDFSSVPKYSEYDEFHKETMKKIQLERQKEEQKLVQMNFRDQGMGLEPHGAGGLNVPELQMAYSPYRKGGEMPEMGDIVRTANFVQNPFENLDENKENYSRGLEVNMANGRHHQNWPFQQNFDPKKSPRDKQDYATFNANPNMMSSTNEKYPNMMSTATEKSAMIMKNLETNNSMKSDNSRGGGFVQKSMNLLSVNDDTNSVPYESLEKRSDFGEIQKQKLNLFETNKSEYDTESPVKKPAVPRIEMINLTSANPEQLDFSSNRSHRKSQNLNKHDMDGDNVSLVSNPRSFKRLNTIKNIRTENSRIMSMKTVTKGNSLARVYDDASLRFIPATPSRSNVSYTTQKDMSQNYKRSMTPKPTRSKAFGTSPKHSQRMAQYSPQTQVRRMTPSKNHVELQYLMSEKSSQKKQKNMPVSSYRQIRSNYGSSRTTNQMPSRSNSKMPEIDPSLPEFKNRTPSRSPKRRDPSPSFHKKYSGPRPEYSGRYIKRIVHRIDGTQEVITDGTPYIPTHQRSERPSPYKNFDYKPKSGRNYTPVKVANTGYINRHETPSTPIQRSPMRGNNLSGYRQKSALYTNQSPYEKSAKRNYQKFERKSPMKNYEASRSPFRNYQAQATDLDAVQSYGYIRDKSSNRVIKVNGVASKEYTRVGKIPKKAEYGISNLPNIQKMANLMDPSQNPSLANTPANLISTSIDDYNPYYRPFGADNTEDETAYEFENPYT